MGLNLFLILLVPLSIRLLNRFAFFFPRPIAQVIRWIHAMVLELFAITAVFILHPFCYLPKRRVLNKNNSGTPILLIHGYLHDCSGWLYHRRQLARAGFGPIYSLNLGFPFHSIKKYAKKVAAFADHIEKDTGRRDLIVIGHSMGGLVCCWYANEMAPSDKVTDVIAIGSPLSGTAIAKIGIGLNAREMERESQFVKDLQSKMRSSKKIRFYQIGTQTDQLIIPYSSAFVGDDPDRQLLLNDIGHVALLFSPRVSTKIQEWLNKRVDPLPNTKLS